MRLRTLQIKGFKSFANDTVLHFNENVIGVVGPNGSGKSNIVDAIRWVLGEQKSKELRLESMGDLIFNGTKNKKEAATATVALTFENSKGILPSEYNEVTISRTLYRSGESEYRLNNVVCRLKDISSLFLDTGIGSNSYAIIALGMVDDILEDKENARRRMFEQAAGISKYKNRKKETLLKLKSATEDLNRVEDLLFEIEGNLKTLEKQAKRTQKFFEIKASYKDISIRHAVHSIQSLKTRYNKVAQLLREQQDVYRENDVRLLSLQANAEKERKVHVDKETLMTSRQKSLGELVYNIRNLESEKGLLQQKLDFKAQQKVSLAKSLQETDDELVKLREEAQLLLQKIEHEAIKEGELKATFEKSSARYNDIKTRYTEIKSGYDEKQKKILLLDHQKFEDEKTIAVMDNNLQNFRNEITRMQEELEIRNKEQAIAAQEHKSLQKKSDGVRSEVAHLEKNESDRLEKIRQSETTKDDLQQQSIKLSRQLDSKQNEYDLLKSMVDNFEGFPESIKFLHDNWNNSSVILSDLLDVQEEYKAVIENYLDTYLNYFVVETQEDAMKAVHLLAKAQRGKANFMINGKLRDFKARFGDYPDAFPAVQVVKISDNYKGLLQFLLQDCYIYHGSEESLSEVLSEVVDSTTFLSSDGTFTQKKHTISGGSVGLFEGKKIGRKQNLDKLSSTITEITSAKNDIDARLGKVAEELVKLKKSELPESIHGLKKTLSAYDQQIAKIQLQLDNFESSKAKIHDLIGQTEVKITDLVKSREEAIARLSLVEAEKRTITDKDAFGEDAISAMSEEMSMATEEMNKENINLIRQQNLLETFRKDSEYKKQRIAENETKRENNRIRLLGEEKEKIDIEDNLRQIDQKLAGLYEDKSKYQATLSEAEQAYFQAKNIISELDDNIRELQKVQQKIQFDVQQLKDEFTELKFKINAVGDRLSIEFNISSQELMQMEPEEGADLESLGLQLESLKSRMANFGEINPLALEAFNEMKVRFDHITSQRKDILEARDSLMDTIQEIESTATEQFFQAFDQIRNNFINVFRSLFTEDDTCDLLLIDPQNPLESDIDIIAKPKGKKPRSLSQLSGGEKTLTATALLFSLYLLKPAPFCIFDEVDAPLDDANIMKFNRIIQKFSKDSQFIIVTHNKATMAEVDLLYGVYMQEPGVSGVSPVDFRSLQHQPLEVSLN